MKRVLATPFIAIHILAKAQDPASVGKRVIETGTTIKKTVENHLPKRDNDGRLEVVGHKVRITTDTRDPGVHGTTFVKGHEVTLGVSLEKGAYGSIPAVGGPMVLGIGLGGHIHAEAPIAGQHYKVGNGLFDIVNDYESGVKASRALSPIIAKQGRQLSKQTEKLRQSAVETTQKAVNSVSKKLGDAADKFKKFFRLPFDGEGHHNLGGQSRSRLCCKTQKSSQRLLDSRTLTYPYDSFRLTLLN